MLIAGNYEVDFKTDRFFKDEITALTQLIKKFLEQLRIYDKLRVDKISLIARALNLLYNSTKDAVVLVDMEKNIFKFNPSARLAFDVEQETFTFDSIRTQKENRRLLHLFFDAAMRKKMTQEGTVTVKLPVQNIEKEVSVKMIPLKDKDERVKLLFAFVSLAYNSEEISEE
ncbi:MAG: hypothetical protein ABH858_05395 [Candidatus Omnitrophota bacterium]